MTRPVEQPSVYAIRNRHDGRLYLGSTIHPTLRWQEHRQALRAGRHHCAPLQAAWNAEGADAFEFLIGEICATDREARAAEWRWLRIYATAGRAYNTILNLTMPLPSEIPSRAQMYAARYPQRRRRDDRPRKPVS